MSFLKKLAESLKKLAESFCGPTTAQRADMDTLNNAAASGDIKALEAYFAFSDLWDSNLATKGFLTAARAGNKASVEFFLSRGALPTRGETVTGETPLSAAQQNGNKDVLALFEPYVQALKAAASIQPPKELTVDDISERIAGLFGKISPRYKAYHEAQKAEAKAAAAQPQPPVI